jgi:hypothetical protein
MKRCEAAAIARAAKNIPPLPERFWSKVGRGASDECWPWLASVRRKDEGYGAFWLNGKHQPANRVAYELKYGPIEDCALEVCHRCDNPACCNPGHMFLGTRRDNNDDKVSKKRHAFGSKNGVAKLTEAQVAEIKRQKPAGRAPPGYRLGLAREYGVKRGTITDIWSRSWKHVT